MVSEEGLNAYGALDVGPVLHLSGLQRTRRLDAHLERRRQHRRVPRDRRQEGRQPVLQVRHRRAADHDQQDRRAVQDRQRHGAEGVHRLSHAPRADRACGRRQVGERPPDAGAAEGAHAVLHAHQGEELQGVPRDDGPAHQLVEQHHLRRRRRQHRLFPFQLHPEARSEVRLDQAGRRQRSGDRMERRALDRRDAGAAQPGQPRGHRPVAQRLLERVLVLRSAGPGRGAKRAAQVPGPAQGP